MSLVTLFILTISLLTVKILAVLGENSTAESTNETDLLTSTSQTLLTALDYEIERRTIVERIVYSFLYLLDALSGILGNVFVILVIINDPVLQIKSQLSNMLILNLAITDFITSTFVTLPGAINVMLDDVPFHKIICIFFSFCNIVTIMATYLTLLLISIDRFIAVGWSLHYSQWVTEKRMMYMLAYVWVHCTLSALSLTILPNYSKFDYWAGICDANWLGHPVVKVLTVIHGTLDFGIPTIFIIGLNVSIVMMSREKGRVGTLNEGTKVETKVNSRILVAMMVVIVFYILLNCPTAVIRLTKVSLANPKSFPNWTTNAGQVMSLTASVVNPLIYGLFRKDFQTAFKKMGKQLIRNVMSMVRL